MTKNSRGAKFLASLALLADQGVPPPSSNKPCPVCGKHKATVPTGECSHCGAYVCRVCHKLHYGIATRDCPGGGVKVPNR